MPSPCSHTSFDIQRGLTGALNVIKGDVEVEQDPDREIKGDGIRGFNGCYSLLTESVGEE